jgi:hypothetical protein
MMHYKLPKENLSKTESAYSYPCNSTLTIVSYCTFHWTNAISTTDGHRVDLEAGKYVRLLFATSE